MLKRLLLISSSFILAFLILVISVFKIAQVKYVFSQSPNLALFNLKEPNINYQLPSPGTIQPDNFLWPFKALRDKVWLTLTFNPSKKADMLLLLADTRLSESQELMKKGNANLSISVLTKAEKYLQMAHAEERLAKKEGMNTSDCLEKYTLATLKHRVVMDEMLTIAPEDARPMIIQSENYPKSLFNEARNGLLQAGLSVPVNPFE